MMNQVPTNRQVGLIGGRGGVYSFELNSGTVVSSQLGPGGGATLPEGISVPHSSSDMAHRSTSELWRLVLIDKLTGLCNQHGFIALADQQWKIARRMGREMVFVGLELSGLPQIRDGHSRGEASLALIAAGRILAKTFRRSDIVCRWSGEQFRALAVNGEDLEEAVLSARIQSLLRRAATPVDGSPWVFKGRMARIRPRAYGSFAEVLARLDQDLAGCTSIWSATPASRAGVDSADVPQR
jgi:diguanylate cyclase (GGDEF)-like protein